MTTRIPFVTREPIADKFSGLSPWGPVGTGIVTPPPLTAEVWPHNNQQYMWMADKTSTGIGQTQSA